jgi:Zn-dependent protease with chaperone function
MDQARYGELVADEVRRPLRRTLDATAMWQIVVLAVVWAGGALLIGFLAGLVEPKTHVDPLIVIGGWTVAGALVFVPAVERVLGRVLLGLRRPTPDQLVVLGEAWARVCHQAGQRADRYVLRVQPSGALNATAGAGHLVAVTSTALSLPPRYLEAVLAHELGHHVGGHAAMGLLHTWYSWPLRTVVRMFGWIGRVANLSVAMLRPFIPLLALAAIPLMVVSCVGLLLVPVIALPVTLATIGMRRSELRADGTAIRLGYGPELLALYRQWAAREQPRGGVVRSTRSFLRDSHPRFDVRVGAIEQALGATTATGKPVQ